jgi:hypothetical protein
MGLIRMRGKGATHFAFAHTTFIARNGVLEIPAELEPTARAAGFVRETAAHRAADEEAAAAEAARVPEPDASAAEA